MRVSSNEQTVGTAERQGKLFKLKFELITPNIEEPQSNIVIENILRLWHERLGHQG